MQTTAARELWITIRNIANPPPAGEGQIDTTSTWIPARSNPLSRLTRMPSYSAEGFGWTAIRALVSQTGTKGIRQLRHFADAFVLDFWEDPSVADDFQPQGSERNPRRFRVTIGCGAGLWAALGSQALRTRATCLARRSLMRDW